MDIWNVCTHFYTLGIWWVYGLIPIPGCSMFHWSHSYSPLYLMSLCSHSYTLVSDESKDSFLYQGIWQVHGYLECMHSFLYPWYLMSLWTHSYTRVESFLFIPLCSFVSNEFVVSFLYLGIWRVHGLIPIPGIWWVHGYLECMHSYPFSFVSNVFVVSFTLVFDESMDYLNIVMAINIGQRGWSSSECHEENY